MELFRDGIIPVHTPASSLVVPIDAYDRSGVFYVIRFPVGCDAKECTLQACLIASVIEVYLLH